MAEQQWKPEDLDRCDHGRHSIDPCLSCPGGWSTGNLYLASAVGDSPVGVAIRIGTNLGGDPIWVVPIRELRPESPATAHEARFKHWDRL